MILSLKNILLFTLLLFNGFAIAQCPLDIGQSPVVSNNGLALYFPFNGNHTNYGSGNYSSMVSGATYTQGICGQAMDFDGINDYVKINPYVPLTGSFTIAAWVYIDSIQHNLCLFATRDQCTSTYRGYSQGEFFINYYNSVQGNYPQELDFNINIHQNCTGYSAGDRYSAQNYTFTSGSWHFVAVTTQNNSNESRTVSFFIDCQLFNSYQYMNYTTSSAFNSSNNNQSYIGAASGIAPWIYSFNGKIDEFRLYNRVLSNAELLDLYHKCKPLDVDIQKYIGNCSGDSAVIELKNTQKNISYQLYDSSNQQFVGLSQMGGCNSLFFSSGLVNAPTNFYIKATNTNSSCGIVLDTIISLNPSTGVSYMIYDTIGVCDGDSVFLGGNYRFAPGVFSDSLIDVHGCDSLVITQLQPLSLPLVDLGSDTGICNNDSILLSIPNTFYSVLWNTGAVTHSILVKNNGHYWVKVSDSLCSNSDTILITNLSQNNITISDTTICMGDSWLINLPDQNTYLWFDGSSFRNIEIFDSGAYYVQITDICKTYTDSFSLTTEDCNCRIFVPNVFTPNGDGLNETFFPVISCELEVYHFYIFNRWGMLLYETTDQWAVWDGKYQGEVVPDGVYFFLIEYVHLRTSAKKNEKRGSVTVLR